MERNENYDRQQGKFTFKAGAQSYTICYKIHNDSRIYFPDIVYYDVDGELLYLPPTTDTHPDPKTNGTSSLPYKTIILNLTAYEFLCRSNLLYTVHAHGIHFDECIDNRKTA